MFKKRALKIFVPLVACVFLAAYAKHRFIDAKDQPVANLQSKDMDETSGLAASAINPGIFYAHNDSGDTSRFFAIDPRTGDLRSTIYFQKEEGRKHIRVQDCEDIAVGPGPKNKKSYVYVGDIGDNGFSRDAVTIYRFEEQRGWKNAGTTSAPFSRLRFKYPDGPRDAEAMAVDPIEKLFYIISKRGDTVSVYTSPIIRPVNDTVTLTFRAKLFFAGLRPFKWITAASISPDGQQILIKSYEKVYYWRRQNNEPLWQTVKRPARELPYKQERQGEAIAFTPDGKGYYTTSEGVNAPIYYYTAPAN